MWPNGISAPVYFFNDQWAVTDYGIECLTPGVYQIPARQLGELRGEFYDWPLHLAEKNWVRLDAFLEAFERGISHHRPAAVSAQRMTTSAAEARDLATREAI